jgi:hypothetical protein
MVSNSPAWITQLFADLKKVEEDVRLLAEAREEEDAIGDRYFRHAQLVRDSKQNASELFREIN